jgi:predicted transcriptional regulator
MTTVSTPDARPSTPGLRPAPAPGLPPRQGAVLAVLWDAPHPLTAAQITTRLTGSGTSTGIYHALNQLRTAGLITATWAGHAHRYQAALRRDDYLAGLIAAALDQAGDPAAVLRTALHTPHRAGNPAPPCAPAWPAPPASWPRGPGGMPGVHARPW